MENFSPSQRQELPTPPESVQDFSHTEEPAVQAPATKKTRKRKVPLPEEEDQHIAIDGEDVTGPPKKKRKAWGQPVGDIKKVIGPRKRARTEEEKEQRAQERILRNRKAADKSRQRQKANMATMEAENLKMKAEVAELRNIVELYLQKHGEIPGVVVPPKTTYEGDHGGYDFDIKQLATTATSPPTPQHSQAPSEFEYASSNYTADHTLVGGGSLDPKTLQSLGDSPYFSLENYSYQPQSLEMDDGVSRPTKIVNPSEFLPGMAHYPAAIVDPQCPMPVKGSKLVSMLDRAHTSRSNRLSILLQILHYLLLEITETSSSVMHWTMSETLRLLALSSQEVYRPFLAQELSKNYPLIHILISMPATATCPAVFRWKLLRTFLSCSSQMPKLLLTATDDALAEVVSREGFTEDADSRWLWSSLMTIKWSIMHYENELRSGQQKGVQIASVSQVTQSGSFSESAKTDGAQAAVVDIDHVEDDVKGVDQCTIKREDDGEAVEVY